MLKMLDCIVKLHAQQNCRLTVKVKSVKCSHCLKIILLQVDFAILETYHSVLMFLYVSTKKGSQQITHSLYRVIAQCHRSVLQCYIQTLDICVTEWRITHWFVIPPAVVVSC